MRYHCIHIRTDFAEEWQADVFAQQMGELGIDTIDGEDYYIPSDILECQIANIQSQISNTEGAQLIGIDACPDENWNATWEAEHPVHELPLGVKIIPHCAFGAGYHDTTAMMIGSLRRAHLNGKTVLDHGTGTGVLAIFAKKRGADKVVAVDIDEKSVENAKENAALNNVEIEVLHTSSFNFPLSTFNLILANIHKNILIENMPQYAAALRPGGELWVSGFYLEDARDMKAAAKKAGLRLKRLRVRNGWLWMKYQKEEPQPKM